MTHHPRKIQLLKDHNVRYDPRPGDALELCVDDFVQYIVESKSVPSYIAKIKDKTKRDGLWYKDAEIMISDLCPKLRSKKAKDFYERWKSLTDNGTESDSVESSDGGTEQQADTLTSFLDIRNNYFQYKGKKVLVLVKDGVAWFKGIDLARLLDFIEPQNAIQHNVSKEDKITFMILRVGFNPTLESQKIDPQTIFLNQEGMYDLVMSSRKPEARLFRRWISHQVLPSINRFGSYSIEKKYGCFYDDHDLYEYDGCNVCYMAFIGVHDGLPLFKYGITFDYYRREYQEHRKTFDTFQLVYLRQTDNNHVIEGLFTKECKSKDVYIQREFKGKNRTELFTVNEIHSFERMRIIMDKLIEQNPTNEHKRYTQEIEQLKQENTSIQQSHERRLELLQTKYDDAQAMISEKNERIQELQTHNTLLQKDKTMLYQLFENLKLMIASIRT